MVTMQKSTQVRRVHLFKKPGKVIITADSLLIRDACRVSRQAVNGWIKRGCPVFREPQGKGGRMPLFQFDSLLEFLNGQRVSRTRTDFLEIFKDWITEQVIQAVQESRPLGDVKMEYTHAELWEIIYRLKHQACIDECGGEVQGLAPRGVPKPLWEEATCSQE